MASPTPLRSNTPANRPTRTELREEFARLLPYFKQAGILSIIAGLLSLTPTFYMQEVYDRVVNSRSGVTLLWLTVIVLFMIAVMELIEAARSKIMQAASHELDNRLKVRVFDAMFSSNLKASNVFGQMPVSDLRTLCDLLTQPVVGAILQVPVAFIFLILIFLIHPSLGWSATFGVAVQFVLAAITEKVTQPPLHQANTAYGKSLGYAVGAMKNAEIVEAMGMNRNVHDRWMKRQEEFLRLQALASDRAGALSSLSKAVQMIQGSALLGLGSWLSIMEMLNPRHDTSGASNGALMIVASILGGLASGPIVTAVMQWKQVVQGRESFQRLETFLEEFPADEPTMPLPVPQGVVQVQQVTAGPPGQQLQILRGVSFHVPAGKVVAIIGPSAAGKTTLARVLLGLWKPLAGSVRLDNADIHQWNKAQLGPHLGYLPQGIELFDGTLAENIARFGPIDRPQLEHLCTLLGLNEMISQLPQGLDTLIGDQGAVLSGGQRQRVGLARAAYGKPRFVVLDEPNSSLDEAGDGYLMNLMRHFREQGTSVVVITHRTNLIQAADGILLLRDGAVAAFGPRDDVLAALAKQAQSAGQAAAQPASQPAAAAAGAPSKEATA